MPSYFIYCRKSSEAEDRQVLSIESQINELKRLAERLNLSVLEVLTEAKTAKCPGRPIFNRMIKRLNQGEVKGIICWKLDRLARNPIDGGSIIWAIKQNDIEIITPAQSYTRESDNSMLMYIEFGMAQKYIDDLSRNVKRGNKTKLEKGWWLGIAPQGYLNDKANKTIIKDPERFNLIKKAWHLLFTESYTVPKIHHILSNEWGYRTRKTKKLGGGQMALSALYKIFTNPFYYGWMERSEGKFPGRHEPMINKDEFDRAQVILGERGKPRPKRHSFAFTGMIRCSECGALITAEEKINRYGYHYTYYHCTKRKPNTRCSQRSVDLEELEKQIACYLDRITISDTFKDYALKYLQEVHKKEVGTRTDIQKAQQKSYNQCLAELDNLTKMRLRDLLNDEEFSEQKVKLLKERAHLKEKFEDTEHRVDSWLALSEKAFTFANRAKYWFENGSLEDKKMILEALGSNLFLKDKKLFIQAKKPFLIIEKGLQEMKLQNIRLEPLEIGLNKAQTGDIYAYTKPLLGLVEDVRTFFINYLILDNSKTAHEDIYIPDLRDELLEAA